MTWFTWSPLELAANLMTAVCIFLAGRNNVHTWWTGIVATILFAVLFFQSQLYADVTLQAFFVVTGIIGFKNWLTKDSWDETHQYIVQEQAPILFADRRTLGLMILTALAVTGMYGYILHKFTNAYAPWVDSAVLSFSVVGQLLLMRRNLQTWPVWLLVNTLSVPLYWSRELYLTSVLYGFFWVNAIVSWRHWLNLMDDQPST